jgi:hypothetical protein
MIPRSYSRDLALQLNFIYDAARPLEGPFEGQPQTLTRRPLRPIWFYLDLQTRRIDNQCRSYWVFSHSYVVLFMLAEFSALLLVLPRPWFFSRHQSDEIPGQLLRKNAA